MIVVLGRDMLIESPGRRNIRAAGSAAGGGSWVPPWLELGVKKDEVRQR